MTLRAVRLLQSCWNRIWTRPRPVHCLLAPRLAVEQLESRLVPSTLTLLAEADARVERANPNRNYGAATELVSDRSPERESLLRFDLTGVTGTVQSAKVRVYVTDGSPNGPAIYATGVTWSEAGVTWNNRPARLSGALDDQATVGAGWLEFDVSSWVTGNGKFSFALASTSSDGVYLHSRERAGFAPQLVVTTADGTAGLVVSAGPDRVAEVGQGLAFAGSASGGTGPLVYTWDFGDGQTATNTANPTHTYTQAGVYTVRFTVRDAAGVSQSDTAVVAVNAVAPGPGVGQNWSSPRQIGTLDTSLVDESSGMAVSRAFSNRLYQINDSGDGGYFYVSDLQGQNTRRIRVNGFSPSDAEDLAYGSFGGKNYLIIGDIGDNGQSRSSIKLVFIEEQETFGTSVTPAFQVTIRYPDGAHNAEALGFHPNGDLYIMTKENPSRVYRLTASQWQNAAGQTQTLQYVGQFGLAGQTGSSSITGMCISPDGRRMLVLTYSGALELETRLNNGVLDFSQYGSSGGAAYKVIKLTKLPQQESISYLANGRDFVYTSEYLGSTVPLYEVDRLD
jgi:hypothetical protein